VAIFLPPGWIYIVCATFNAKDPMPTCSLLISTYNWPEAFLLCLDSILGQTVKPDEIIICDDGSGEATAEVIHTFSKKTTIPVIHVWQQDEGFQLAKIRNKGFARAKYEYLIQIDGDLILGKHFISDHLRFARKKYFATGSRVLLSPQTTKALIENRSTEIKKYSIGDRNLFNGLHIPFLQPVFALIYKNKGKHKFYVKGCNMAFWKEDLLKVNGYNENFTGWGREDSELAIRLINSGIKKRFLKFGGIAFHLYHNEASREMEEANTKMMEDAVRNQVTTTSKGLDQYL
jgi:glycosyltransferase involved in cell wall biosynthesis